MQRLTIDGVPRDDLHELHVVLCNMEVQDGSVYADIRDRLRALLDSPAVESELSRMTRRCQNAELALKVQAENYESLKADQPQGAPVAVGTVKMHGDMKCIAFGDEEWKALNVGDIIFSTGARVDE